MRRLCYYYWDVCKIDAERCVELKYELIERESKQVCERVSYSFNSILILFLMLFLDEEATDDESDHTPPAADPSMPLLDTCEEPVAGPSGVN